MAKMTITPGLPVSFSLILPLTPKSPVMKQNSLVVPEVAPWGGERCLPNESNVKGALWEAENAVYLTVN